MKASTREQLEQFVKENFALSNQVKEVEAVVVKMADSYEKGGKILVCGNGGSAADSEHIVGEMMKGFLKKRPLTEQERRVLKPVIEGEEEHQWICQNLQRGIPAISLVSNSALMTAYNNDVEPALVFAQQVMGYGRAGDVFIGLSTSGNSKNVVYGAKVAKSLGMTVVSYTGAPDSKLSEISDITLRSNARETYKVQEDHIRLYHLMCALLENELYEI